MRLPRPIAARPLALAGLSAALVAAGPAAADDVVESTLLVKGRVRDARALDLDGDSRREIVVLSVSGYAGSARRYVSAFWQSGPGRFPLRPDQEWEIDRATAALDSIVDLDRPAGGGALFSLRADGVYRHALPRGGPVSTTRVLEVPLAALLPEDEWITQANFAGPWIGDGEDLLLPGLPGPSLSLARDGSYGPPIPLPVQADARYQTPDDHGALRAIYDFPAPGRLIDQAGRRHLVFFRREQLVVIDPLALREPRASPAGDPPGVRSFPLDILGPEEAISDRDVVHGNLVDLDGDGRSDLVALVYRETGVLELSGRIMVFRARPDGSFPRAADQVLEIEDGLYYLAQLRDLDGDGRVEILVPSTRLGLWGYVRFLTTKKVSVLFRTLSLGDDGKYDLDAVAADPFTLRLSGSFDIPVVQYADLDGDGVQDLVAGHGQDRVCVHPGVAGSEEHRFGARPRICFPADPFYRYRRVTLDDGRDALLRFDRKGDHRNAVTVTLLDE